MLPTSIPPDILFSCRKLFVQDLKIQCYIGAYEHEKLAPQEVIFNIELWLPTEQSTSANDDLTDVINYDLVVQMVEKCAHSQHFNLQETLLDQVASELKKIPSIRLMHLSCCKTQAYPNVKSVGFEIWSLL